MDCSSEHGNDTLGSVLELVEAAQLVVAEEGINSMK
jgi:hypothetical protein